MKKQAVLLLISLLVGGPAFACSCMPDVAIGDHFERASHVFTAVVTDTRRPTVPDSLRGDSWLDRDRWDSVNRVLEGSFRVTASFKGDAAALPAVYTHLQSVTCGLTLVRGEEYLFFADARGVVGLCGGNVARSSPVYREVMGDLRRYQAELARPMAPPGISAAEDE